MRSVQRLLLPIQGRSNRTYDVMRHAVIDLARELDETGFKIPLFRLPGKIERVDRNAVPTQPRAGIKCLKPEWLGRRRFDHLPDVNSHAQTEKLKLIDQSNVDATVDVFEQLCHLRRSRRGKTDCAMEDRSIKCGRKFGCIPF